jgi:hypothetical protein
MEDAQIMKRRDPLERVFQDPNSEKAVLAGLMLAAAGFLVWFGSCAPMMLPVFVRSSR